MWRAENQVLRLKQEEENNRLQTKPNPSGKCAEIEIIVLLKICKKE